MEVSAKGSLKRLEKAVEPGRITIDVVVFLAKPPTSFAHRFSASWVPLQCLDRFGEGLRIFRGTCSPHPAFSTSISLGTAPVRVKMTGRPIAIASMQISKSDSVILDGIVVENDETGGRAGIMVVQEFVVAHSFLISVDAATGFNQFNIRRPRDAFWPLRADDPDRRSRTGWLPG